VKAAQEAAKCWQEALAALEKEICTMKKGEAR